MVTGYNENKIDLFGRIRSTSIPLSGIWIASQLVVSLVKCIQRNMSRKLLCHSCMVQMMDLCWHWSQLDSLPHWQDIYYVAKWNMLFTCWKNMLCSESKSIVHLHIYTNWPHHLSLLYGLISYHVECLPMVAIFNGNLIKTDQTMLQYPW